MPWQTRQRSRLLLVQIGADVHLLAIALDVEIEIAGVEGQAEQAAELADCADLGFAARVDDVMFLEQTWQGCVRRHFGYFHAAISENGVNAVVFQKIAEGEEFCGGLALAVENQRARAASTFFGHTRTEPKPVSPFMVMLPPAIIRLPLVRLPSLTSPAANTIASSASAEICTLPAATMIEEKQSS